MSLLYGQLDEMDSSLDNLEAEVTDVVENDELLSNDGDDQLVGNMLSFLVVNFYFMST